MLLLCRRSSRNVVVICWTNCNPRLVFKATPSPLGGVPERISRLYRSRIFRCPLTQRQLIVSLIKHPPHANVFPLAIRREVPLQFVTNARPPTVLPSASHTDCTGSSREYRTFASSQETKLWRKRSHVAIRVFGICADIPKNQCCLSKILNSIDFRSRQRVQELALPGF